MKFKLPVGDEHCLYFTKEELEYLYNMLSSNDENLEEFSKCVLLYKEIKNYCEIMGIIKYYERKQTN